MSKEVPKAKDLRQFCLELIGDNWGTRLCGFPHLEKKIAMPRVRVRHWLVEMLRNEDKHPLHSVVEGMQCSADRADLNWCSGLKLNSLSISGWTESSSANRSTNSASIDRCRLRDSLKAPFFA